tara:strand:- start:234 stop:398 length:165 start_codon:yes stop_codon:yes gene_type:complete
LPYITLKQKAKLRECNKRRIIKRIWKPRLQKANIIYDDNLDGRAVQIRSVKKWW